jgi:hypothetical protein
MLRDGITNDDSGGQVGRQEDGAFGASLSSRAAQRLGGKRRESRARIASRIAAADSRALHGATEVRGQEVFCDFGRCGWALKDFERAGAEDVLEVCGVSSDSPRWYPAERGAGCEGARTIVTKLGEWSASVAGGCVRLAILSYCAARITGPRPSLRASASSRQRRGPAASSCCSSSFARCPSQCRPA